MNNRATTEGSLQASNRLELGLIPMGIPMGIPVLLLFTIILYYITLYNITIHYYLEPIRS